MKGILTLGILGFMVLAAAGAVSDAQRIPLDLSIQTRIDSLADEFGDVSASTTKRYQQNREYSFIAGAQVAAVGVVTDPVGYRGHKRGIMTRWLLHVEQGVYGCAAGGTLSFSVMGGSVDGTGRINAIAPSLWSGGRFLFLLGNPGFPDSADYFVGGAASVYEVREGVVERKGVPLSEFTPIVRDILVEREPESLFRSASDVVVGAVLSITETTEFEPYKHTVKLVPFEVSEKLKGSSTSGDTLLIRVPNETGVMLHRSPKFIRGERALVFLSKQQDGAYRVLEDTAGKYMLEFTDVFAAPEETAEVLAAMRELSGGQPN